MQTNPTDAIETAALIAHVTALSLETISYTNGAWYEAASSPALSLPIKSTVPLLCLHKPLSEHTKSEYMAADRGKNITLSSTSSHPLQLPANL